jgi:hypothetical protein
VDLLVLCGHGDYHVGVCFCDPKGLADQAPHCLLAHGHTAYQSCAAADCVKPATHGVPLVNVYRDRSFQTTVAAVSGASRNARNTHFARLGKSDVLGGRSRSRDPTRESRVLEYIVEVDASSLVAFTFELQVAINNSSPSRPRPQHTTSANLRIVNNMDTRIPLQNH